MGRNKDVLYALAEVIATRKAGLTESSEPSYVAGLFAQGLDTVLKKLIEEAAEAVIAGKGGNREEVVYEIADLWFHSLVLLAYYDLGPASVISELERRFGQSGLKEKAARGSIGAVDRR